MRTAIMTGVALAAVSIGGCASYTKGMEQPAPSNRIDAADGGWQGSRSRHGA